MSSIDQTAITYSSNADVSAATENNTMKYLPIVVVIAALYMIYVSPWVNEKSVRETTNARRAAYRWIDFVTKMIIVFMVVHIASQDATVALVAVLVFALMLMHTTQRVIIETKKAEHFENTINSEEIVTINDEVTEEPKPSDEAHKRHTPGVSDSNICDIHGCKYLRCNYRVDGLLVDTVAESEEEAVKQGLGMTVVSNQEIDDFYDVTGIVFDYRSDVSMSPVDEESDDDNSGNGLIDSVEGFDSTTADDRSSVGGDAHHPNDMTGDKRETISQAMNEAIEHPVHAVAKEVEEEKDVKVSEDAKNEVRRAVRYVVHRMAQDGKTATHHDMTMVCRMVYGQMYECKGMIRKVEEDVGLVDDSSKEAEAVEATDPTTITSKIESSE